MAGVTLQAVTKSYDGKNQIIQPLNVTVNDGEFMVMVGPSGCGKSTLLRMVAGLERVTSGDIYIDDRRVTQLEPKDRGIAMVFQNYALYPHMTVEENMAYGLKIRGMSKEHIRLRVLEAARSLELDQLLSRRPRELSGGQRQRVAIARALIAEPEALLLDEPTSALDVSVQAEILNLLSDLRSARNLTYILVTHNLAVVAHLCQRIGVMQHGEMVEQLSADDLRARRIHHPHTAQLFDLSIGLEEPA